MNGINDLTQILYEISMAIGSSLNLNQMCRDVALVTLRKLNSTAFVVFQETHGDEGEGTLDRAFITPKNYLKNDNYTLLEEAFPKRDDGEHLSDFYSTLPTEIFSPDGGIWYVMGLPGFGALAVFRARGPFPPYVIQSLTPLNKKFAIACNACIAHENLDASERKYKLLMETMTEGVATLDDTGALTYVNQGMARMLGYKASALNGMAVARLFDEDATDVFLRSLETVNQGQPACCELTWKTSLGTELHTLTSLNPCLKSDWDDNYCFMVITDASAQKQAEEQYTQIQKMEAIGTLAGGIAHDFNNMLGVIIGNASLLSIKLKDDALRPMLADIETATLQAQALTTQLLTFSKGGDPVKDTKDINQLVRESAEFVLRGAQASCEFDLWETLPAVEIDSGQINQVISNLLINANQAMPAGGVISIHTECCEVPSGNSLALQPNTYAKVTLKDQGIGISEKIISKIFDPFFTTKQTGNGLGLASAYSIVKKHKGTITVSSKQGVGTEFSVYLPLTDKSVSVEDKNKGVLHSGSGRILVLDDNYLMLEILEHMLLTVGYETVLTQDGQETVEAYKQSLVETHPFDLVLLDLTIPGGMGGLAALKELQTLDPTVKAVVSSGYSNDPVMANYEEYGFCGVVSKPYRIHELASLLNKAMGG
ncbi:hypothetical protein BVX99_03510 [bacterium F16]|nr:hypothetical protein BVX99_03510 [bacterium F16]